MAAEAKARNTRAGRLRFMKRRYHGRRAAVRLVVSPRHLLGRVWGRSFHLRADWQSALLICNAQGGLGPCDTSNSLLDILPIVPYTYVERLGERDADRQIRPVTRNARHADFEDCGTRPGPWIRHFAAHSPNFKGRA